MVPFRASSEGGAALFPFAKKVVIGERQEIRSAGELPIGGRNLDPAAAESVVGLGPIDGFVVRLEGLAESEGHLGPADDPLGNPTDEAHALASPWRLSDCKFGMGNKNALATSFLQGSRGRKGGKRPVAEVEAKMAILVVEDFALEIGALAKAPQGGWEIEKIVAKTRRMADEAMIGLGGLADAERAESGRFRENQPAAAETTDADVIAARAEFLEVIGGVAPGGFVGNEIGSEVSRGTRAERKAKSFLGANQRGVGFGRPRAVAGLVGESGGGAPVDPGDFLAGRREEGTDDVGIVDVRKSNGLRQMFEICGGVHHVREKQVVAVEGALERVTI